MEIQKMKDLLKDHNHILIDYSDKFIDTDYEISIGNNKYISRASKIYLEIKDKTKEDKYDNVVFLLDISKLVKYNHVFFMLLIKNSAMRINPQQTNVYMLHNTNNVCIIPHGEFEKDKKMLVDVIKQKRNEYSCHVCFEEKPIWNETEYCAICNFRTCIKCILKAGNLNKKCFSCRTETNDKYDVLYSLLSQYIDSKK